MAISKSLLVALIISAVALYSASVNAHFGSDMYFTWGAQHSFMSNHGNDLQLVLDKTSGSGVITKNAYLFGSIEIQLKLIPGNSAGTVTTYYAMFYTRKNQQISEGKKSLGPLSSTGDKHDEIDFEFLGNVSGQPYTVHTNIFAQGKGNKEQQFYLWFDPTADYHNYTIHWNPTEVVWYVDTVPIRVFRNYESQGIAYPNQQGMKVYSTLWNADDWATQGGRVKTDWKKSPFVAQYRGFEARACKWQGMASIYECPYPNKVNWWTSPSYKQLSLENQGKMKWVRDNYMIYDYCKDFKRFNGQIPQECYKPQF